jgi:hypothetical protein
VTDELLNLSPTISDPHQAALHPGTQNLHAGTSSLSPRAARSRLKITRCLAEEQLYVG